MISKRVITILLGVSIIFCGAQIAYIVNCLFEKEAPASVPGEEDVVIRNGNRESDHITFTCNVDWGEEVLPRMLNTFKDKDIKVTFFVSGKWAEDNPKLLRRMYIEGHEIQSHGYSHKLCSKISVSEIKEEIEKTEFSIKRVLGIVPDVFAPPAGDYDEKTLDLCRAMGYKVSLWSSDTIDWREGSTAEIIKKRVLDKPLAGAIVLMHPKDETAKALPSLIDEIRRQGIKIVPLKQLGVY